MKDNKIVFIAFKVIQFNLTVFLVGGEKKVESQKLQWNAKPRIGSLENAKHKPRKFSFLLFS
jgi:hypothetical protein